MKKIHRLFALVLSLLLLASLALPVAANSDTPTPTATTYSITIDKNESGRTYYAYQIFTGNVAAQQMTDIDWGNGISDDGQKALYRKFSLTDTAKTPGNVAEKINTPADARAIAELLMGSSGNLTSEKTAIPFNTTMNKYYQSGFAGGYYLIVEATNLGQTTDDAVSAYMMHIVRNVELTPKDSVPSMDKMVADINDSTQDKTDNHQHSADYDIGDHVPFHIHISLGNNVEQYAQNGYEIVITDTLSAGLTFDGKESMRVTYGNDHVIDPSCYNVSTVNAQNQFTITFPNFFSITSGSQPINIASYGNLKIDYTATLNSSAVIGSAGNPNKAIMQFSNNPHNAESHGTTPEKEAIVFTYQLVVNKTDEQQNPLTGAEFKLEKRLQDNQWVTIQFAETGGNNSTFTFKGLDDGIYRLTEMKAPSGYNSVDPMTFKVEATHEGTQLTTLSGTKIDGVIALSAGTLSDGKLDGSLNTTVINESGAILPSTGGIGTTIFYVAGGLLVCVAIVLLVTKKRMSTEE